jgi:outer membrane protein assembly factor BamD
LIWRKGEGWSYERHGITTAKNPKEQLELARSLQAQKRYGDAITAYRRLVRRWPTAFAVEEGRLGLAESLSAVGYHYKAHLEYQNLITKHPNSAHFETALQRQFEIGKRFLGGERHKVLGLKIFPSIEKAIEVFEQIVKNAPYGKIGAQAQFQIGQAYEKQKDYLAAVRAYEKVLERYPDDPMAEKSQFQIGLAYRKEAARAEYDQNAANQAIAAFSDYSTRYPRNENTAKADQYRVALKEEQSKGLFRVAQFYEKNKNYKSALIYYNEVIAQNPKSDWAANAQKKILQLKQLEQRKAQSKK